MITFGIVGGSSSGKTTLAVRLGHRLESEYGSAVLVSQDSYYRDLRSFSSEQRKAFNFDHPEAVEFDLLIDHLARLKAGESVDQPVYDFTSHIRTDRRVRIEPRPFLILEGILIFYPPELRELMDLRVFVDASDDVRLRRRLERDVLERGRTAEDVIRQYHETVRPMYEQFVEPTRCHAHIIVDGEKEIDWAVQEIVAHVDRLG